MVIEKAFIQQIGNNRLRIEEQFVSEYVEKLGIPIQMYTEKFIHRRSLPLTMNSLVVGDMPCVIGALKQLEIKVPEANSYPSSLREYMHRNIWEMSLAQLEANLRDGLSKPIFAKPRFRQKKFTGQVFNSESDLYYVSGASRHLELYCCDFVKWVSEFRVYVVESEIREIAYYDGDESVHPSEKVIQSAINELYEAGEAYAAFGIDFGVLSSGETALIEMNDGFALGAYKVSPSDYGELVYKRWLELLDSKNA